MRSIAIPALLLTACGPDGEAAPRQGAPAASPETPPDGSGRWEGSAGGALRFADAGGRTVLAMACADGEWRVHVAAFTPIGSEERLSLGIAGDAVAMVADPVSPPPEGGMAGAIAPPPDLPDLLAAPQPLSAAYGAQRTREVPPPPPALAEPFSRRCLGGAE